MRRACSTNASRLVVDSCRCDQTNKHVNITFRKLQSKDLILSQQCEELKCLALILYEDIDIDGPFESAQIQELE